MFRQRCPLRGKKCSAKIAVQETDRPMAFFSLTLNRRVIYLSSLFHISHAVNSLVVNLCQNCKSYPNVYINEDLTKYSAEILKSSRNQVKHKDNILSALSCDGRIYNKTAIGN